MIKVSINPSLRKFHEMGRQENPLQKTTNRGSMNCQRMSRVVNLSPIHGIGNATKRVSKILVILNNTINRPMSEINIVLETQDDFSTVTIQYNVL